ncbi:hypothetical protein EUTSA_v10027147mg [Eutrema salsugineum]|uniref:Serine aminopeptidase S33 domain-containing protein n=2 Tax=Eutrema salsugineum TaxID=72664 RepID=V4MGP5_EUTSA|nr:uncharacterized protein LOC18029458 isoform X1 [Eutrema salsugineum]ESQ55719.1 hypothetical protein EUTSA_v10027147mg [Eutrema salsugineum]
MSSLLLGGIKMIDQFINFVIRPPRAEYDPDQYLWEKDFSIGSTKCKRQDLELTNSRGHTLRCSHYIPSSSLEDNPLPCVIYCHGNSGCRADANEAAMVLLPSNITVFTLDFSGSGLSDGDYVSLGWHEKDDLKTVVSYLRNSNQVSRIGLWGRSMGAVTSLLYGAEDPSIAGMVLDSGFSNLFDLMMELVDVYKIRLPKFTVKMAVQYMRRVIQKKAKFNIMDLNCLKVSPKTFIPALFGHASGDKFIQPHHSDLILKCYAGDKNIIKFDGDHNSSRPQFYYDSVLIFFYNVLRPPQISSACSSKLESYYNLGDIDSSAGLEESFLYEIISGLRSACIDVGSSSSAPPAPLTTKPTNELLSEATMPITDMDEVLVEDNDHNMDDPENFERKFADQFEEGCSFTSSNRESWGRCSSLGGTEEDESLIAGEGDQVEKAAVENAEQKPRNSTREEEEEERKEKKIEKGGETDAKKPRREKLERLEAFSKRLRLCIIKRVNHGRHRSQP